MLAITGGRVLTMAGKNYERATVLIKDGKIEAVGEDVKVPPGAEEVDASGRLVLPGFIDAHCHVGVVEEIYREEGDDGNEITDPVTPHLRAIDGINPADLGFRDALEAGVTTVVTGPGSANVIGGEMAALKTSGEVVDDMVLWFPAGVKAAPGENPKRTYGREKKMPVTRMATAALLREALVQAQNYLKKIEDAECGRGEFPERDLKKEALLRVLRREVPLRVHAHRADDIMTALRIGREFNLWLIIEHCTEGHLVVDRLAAAGVAVVLGPVLTNRSKVELKERTLETAAVLARKKVPFAIMTDHPVVPIGYLPLSAALVMRGGLSEDKALESITSGAARVIGLDHRVGSLEPGKDGDVIIVRGHPLGLNSRVEKVFIDGRLVYSI